MSARYFVHAREQEGVTMRVTPTVDNPERVDVTCLYADLTPPWAMPGLYLATTVESFVLEGKWLELTGEP